MINQIRHSQPTTIMFRKFSTLSNTFSHVQTVLRNKGHDFEVVKLENTRTANDAAEKLGCDVAQIVKSILFRTEDSKQPILVLASGANRVNEHIIASLTKQTIIKAEASFAKKVTGFSIQCIPPLGHKNKIETYIDQDLFKFDNLWASLDNRSALFSLKSKDLNILIDGKVISINNNPYRLRRF